MAITPPGTQHGVQLFSPILVARQEVKQLPKNKTQRPVQVEQR